MVNDSVRDELAALAASIESFIEERLAAVPPGFRRDPKARLGEVDHYYKIYSRILAKLKSEDSDVFGALPERVPVLVEMAAPTPEPVVSLTGVSALLRDVRHCLAMIPASTVRVAMSGTREGVFFAGQRSDAMKLVLDIVALARVRLEVIDAYMDASTLSILTKDPRLRVEILTKPLDPAEALRMAAVAKGKNVEVRTSTAFHDRFIAVDGADLYHFGASIKDAGARGFMFSRIEEQAAIKAMRDEWTRVWSSAPKAF